MTGHLAGRPVSARTYSVHKCRCDGCRDAVRAMQNTSARAKWTRLVRSRAERAAIQYVEYALPGVWAGLMADARVRVEAELGPIPGKRPAQKGKP